MIRHANLQVKQLYYEIHVNWVNFSNHNQLGRLNGTLPVQCIKIIYINFFIRTLNFLHKINQLILLLADNSCLYHGNLG